MIKIRLARQGRKKIPFYHIVVADAKSPRDGRFIEQLGYYDPLKKTHSLKSSDVLKWIKNGAQITDGFERVIKKFNISDLMHLVEDSSKNAYHGLSKKDKAEKIKTDAEEKKKNAAEKKKLAEEAKNAAQQENSSENVSPETSSEAVEQN